MFPYGNCRTSLGKVPKTWKRNNIASNVRVATECLLKLSLHEMGVRPWAQIKWGRGDKFPPNLAQMRKNGKTTLKIEKFVIRTPTPCTYPGFRLGGVGLTQGCHKILIPANDANHSYLVWKHCKDILVGKVKKKVKAYIIISLALLELSQSISPNCPPELRVRSWAQITEGVGDMPPQARLIHGKTFETTLK